MKKNERIARQLLKIAKELVAINPYEKQIKPDRMIKVWNEDYEEIIERLSLFVQLRDAIKNNLGTISALKDKISDSFHKIGDDDKKIEAFLKRLENNPALTHNYDYTINLKQQPSLKHAYAYVTNNNSYMQKIENGIMEEFLVLNQALQTMAFVSSDEFTKTELSKYTGIDKKILEKLMSGMAPDFLKEMENQNYDVETGTGERGALRGLDSMTQLTEKDFEDRNVKDHKIRINNVIMRLQLGEANSRVIIQKLNEKDKYLSEVLATTSFTSAAFDKELGQNFEKQNGVFVPSAKGGEFKGASKKTAGVMDSIKDFFMGIVGKLSKVWNSIKNFFSKMPELDTTEESQKIIDNLKFDAITASKRPNNAGRGASDNEMPYSAFTAFASAQGS